jgi:triosephosphate isomerase
MESIPDLSGPCDFVVAYEPAWAIGSGRTPRRDEIADMHATIRRLLLDRFGPRGSAARILYGGSLKPANAAEILSAPCVDGGLVGTASLSPTEFYQVITAGLATASAAPRTGS